MPKILSNFSGRLQIGLKGIVNCLRLMCRLKTDVGFDNIATAQLRQDILEVSWLEISSTLIKLGPSHLITKLN